ncbi:MAG: type II toxin-antitoxin system RatA family toxin [Pseudomonadota bacterium]|nr:MAG: type II toxin-antitoxin system RatA family toxin [Pseudomonadota bacterium]
MYKLVSDIPAYPQFLPWCGGARVLSRDGEQMEAAIDIAYHGVHKSFTTRNRLIEAQSIEMNLLHGPFKHLKGLWKFSELDPASCKVTLDMEFDFSNRLLSLAVGPVFTQIANGMVDSFLKRAIDVYGRR